MASNKVDRVVVQAKWERLFLWIIVPSLALTAAMVVVSIPLSHWQTQEQRRPSFPIPETRNRVLEPTILTR